MSRAKNNAELYECFKSIEYNLVEFIFLSGKWELFESLDKYINISSNPVLTGNDIMKALNLNPGPIIGKLLDKVKKAQFEGIIKTKQDALNYLKNIPD
ncbi:MAG: hypothetical protein GXO99_00655 [Nitrospirae bacterium]|nr:hypothetical protein [Nitrospirota bacterium]